MKDATISLEQPVFEISPIPSLGQKDMFQKQILSLAKPPQKREEKMLLNTLIFLLKTLFNNAPSTLAYNKINYTICRELFLYNAVKIESGSNPALY